MENFDVNEAFFFWECLCPLLFKLAVHLGKKGSDNLRSIKNQSKRSLKLLFHATEKFVTDYKEITKYPSDRLAAAHLAQENFAH